jgi:hypothetical protein
LSFKSHVFFAVACSASALACSAILGLQEPTVDDTLEAGTDSGGGDTQTDAPGSDTGVDAACGADLQNDKGNCGTCGHDCLGGDCQAGVCQPVLVTQSSSIAPYAMVLNAGILYFTNVRAYDFHTVGKVDATATNGSASQLVDYNVGYTNPLVDALPWGLAVRNGYFYTTLYANGGQNNLWEGGVDRCPLSGCTGNTISVYGIDSYAVGTSSTDVYYGSTDINSNYALMKAPRDFSSAATAVATPASEIDGLVVDGTDVFYGTTDGVFACNPTCGTSPITQGGALDAEQMVVDANNIYFASTPFNGAPTVQSVSRGGGLPKLIASDVTLPVGIAIDANYVYFADVGDTATPTTGKVVRCPLAGCTQQTETVLSTGAAAGDNPRAIVVDNAAIYWGTRGGHIWRLAK